jgi:hypothetical protein
MGAALVDLFPEPRTHRCRAHTTLLARNAEHTRLSAESFLATACWCVQVFVMSAGPDDEPPSKRQSPELPPKGLASQPDGGFGDGLLVRERGVLQDGHRRAQQRAPERRSNY